MIAVTGANGQFGTLVIEGLLKKVPAGEIVAVVRKPAEASALQQLGVQVRQGDYDQFETLAAAFQGVEKVLLISAVVPGQRLRQHKAVIDAAKTAGVTFVAYTSMLNADTSTHMLAAEHLATEQYLLRSGLKFALLRNAWYLDNHIGMVDAALQHGALVGSAGEGRFASATRADLAQAAVEVLTKSGQSKRTYELAGDSSFSMGEFAQEIARAAGKRIVYNELQPEAYRTLLTGLGLPSIIVDVLVDADLKARLGDFDSSSKDLSQLIGHSTTTLSEAVTVAVSGGKSNRAV
jgi:NAD(P)H dehydrogenase (quinone)